MPAEIGLADGTKIHADLSASEVREELTRMAEAHAGTPFGDWLMLGDEVWFNPAQVVYVKNVKPPQPAGFDRLG